MTKYMDMPETIPIFPLPGALLLPRARLPLHLFEPRYLTMLDDALSGEAATRSAASRREPDAPRGDGAMPDASVDLGASDDLDASDDGASRAA